jgi:hypothetical protein
VRRGSIGPWPPSVSCATRTTRPVHRYQGSRDPRCVGTRPACGASVEAQNTRHSMHIMLRPHVVIRFDRVDQEIKRCCQEIDLAMFTNSPPGNRTPFTAVWNTTRAPQLDRAISRERRLPIGGRREEHPDDLQFHSSREHAAAAGRPMVEAARRRRVTWRGMTPYIRRSSLPRGARRSPGPRSCTPWSRQIWNPTAGAGRPCGLAQARHRVLCRGTSRRTHSVSCPGGACPLEHLPFLSSFQAVFWHAAASIPHDATDRTSQDTVSEAFSVRHGHCVRLGFQSNECVQRGVS